jgi:Icc-related predicted phosphoesterase
MKMKNKEEVVENVKRIEMKCEDLREEIRELLILIGKCDELDYFEIENLKTYNKIIQEKISELDKNASIVNVMKYSINLLEE